MYRNFNQEGRIEALDLLKVFAAFLVILGHCLSKYAIGSTSTPLYNFIWLTQMPLFMFVSGYTNTNFEKVNSISKYLYRTLKNVLVLVFPCITYLLFLSLIEQNSFGTLFVSFFKDPTPYLWFLWVLFLIRIVFDLGLYIGSKLRSSFKVIIPLLVSLGLSLITLIFIYKKIIDGSLLALKYFAYYTPFYCLGFVFNLLIKANIFEGKNIKIVSYVILGIMVVGLAFECFYFESIYSFDDSKILFLLIRVLGSVCAIFICAFIADLVCSFKIPRQISKCGAYTLQTFYIHELFLKVFNFSSGTKGIYYLESFGVSLLLLVIVALILIAMYFVPFLHLLIFGKSFSRYDVEKKIPKIFR